jgi:hypothetical protein
MTGLPTAVFVLMVAHSGGWLPVEVHPTLEACMTQQHEHHFNDTSQCLRFSRGKRLLGTAGLLDTEGPLVLARPNAPISSQLRRGQ